MNQAVAAAAAALPASLSETRSRRPGPEGVDPELIRAFGAEFAKRFFHREQMVPALAAVDVGNDPVLRDIAEQHPEGYLVDLRAVDAPAFVPLLHLFDAWPIGHTRITRYCGGLILAVHLTSVFQ